MVYEVFSRSRGFARACVFGEKLESIVALHRSPSRCSEFDFSSDLVALLRILDEFRFSCCVLLEFQNDGG